MDKSIDFQTKGYNIGDVVKQLRFYLQEQHTMQTLTNRQIAQNILVSNKNVLLNEGTKAFRSTCMLQIKEQTTAKDTGATYNDARKILINKNELNAESFKRFGTGRNHTSGPRIERPLDATWKLVNKADDSLVSYHTSRAKAYASRTDKATQKAVKL